MGAPAALSALTWRRWRTGKYTCHLRSFSGAVNVHHAHPHPGAGTAAARNSRLCQALNLLNTYVHSGLALTVAGPATTSVLPVFASCTCPAQQPGAAGAEQACACVGVWALFLTSGEQDSGTRAPRAGSALQDCPPAPGPAWWSLRPDGCSGRMQAPHRVTRRDGPAAPNRAAHACKGAPGGQLKGARLVFAACPRDCCSAASALLQPSAPLQAQLLRSTGGGCGRTQARAGRQGPRVPFLGLREKQMLHGQDECCQAVCLVCLQQAEDGTGTAVLSGTLAAVADQVRALLAPQNEHKNFPHAPGNEAHTEPWPTTPA